jgi:hypothetical protein
VIPGGLEELGRHHLGQPLDAGDTVIDGSVRRRLDSLRQALRA